MKKISTNKESGFTLVEVMISIGLFTVIMVIGIGAILGVNATNKKTQSMRAIIDNMSFVMEDMARSMRLGDYFVCTDLAPGYDDVYLAGTGQITNDGPDSLSTGPCKGIAFEPYWDFRPIYEYNQVAYYISDGAIWKKDPENLSYGSQNMVVITPLEIDIDEERSGFTVTGSDRTDTRQPQVTILLVGTITLNGVATDFNMQTSVSQRVLDVESIGSTAGSTGVSGGTTLPSIPSDPGGGAIPSLPTP